MAETQSGLAIVWSCDGISFTVGIVSSGTGKFQSASFVRDSEKAYIKNDSGETCGRIDFDLKRTLTLTVIPCAATSKGTAVTNLDSWTPPPGTKVTVVDGDGGILDEKHGGIFLVTRVTQNRTNTGAATAEVELEQFDANDISSTVS